MDTTKHLSITLPAELADALRERVTSGAYSSESEVIQDGLRELFAQDEAVEGWLQTEVVAAYDELRSDPSQAVAVEDVRLALRDAHLRRRGVSDE